MEWDQRGPGEETGTRAGALSSKRDWEQVPSSQQLQDRQLFFEGEYHNTGCPPFFAPSARWAGTKYICAWEGLCALSSGSDAKQSEEYVQGKRSHRAQLDMRTDQGSAD